MKIPGADVPEAASAEFASAAILITNDKISFGPAAVQMENNQTAEIEGEYALDNSHAGLKISSRQLTIAEVQSRAEQVISAPPIPLLEKLRQGTWKGWIAFDRSGDRPGVWSGEYDLQNAHGNPRRGRAAAFYFGLGGDEERRNSYRSHPRPCRRPSSWKANTGTIRMPAGRIASASKLPKRNSRRWNG